MVDQAEIHRKAASGDVEERVEAVRLLRNNFADLPDEEQAWEDLHRLTQDVYYSVWIRTVTALGAIFQHIPNKKQAWDDMCRLIQNMRMGDVVGSGIGALRLIFQHIPDEKQAYDDLRKLTMKTLTGTTWNRAILEAILRGRMLGVAFQYVPDKEQAWEDLYQLTQDEDGCAWLCAVWTIHTAVPHIPDKEQVWGVLCKIVQNDPFSSGESDEIVYLSRLIAMFSAVDAMGVAFQYVPDKEQAWENLHNLTMDERGIWLKREEAYYYYCRQVRRQAASALGDAFPHIPDKEQAWGDMYRLARDGDGYACKNVLKAIGRVFPHIPDKKQACEYLYRKADNGDGDERKNAIEAIGRVFPHIPDKEEAWKDLHQLTQNIRGYSDKHKNDKRKNAIEAIGSVFPHIPDKKQAWEDMHRLARDGDSYVRKNAIETIGSVFPHIPDKEEAWKDLIQFTRDKHIDVRVSANHSLGRASIFKATKAEGSDDFKSELKNAIEFFERSSKEATYSNPSSFCLPFYRSFYSLTFEKAEGGVQKYLADAKSASEGSENKETLLEAVENLANALSEAHKARDFDATKSDLKAYMQYCNRAADLIGDAAEGAPGAARVLKRGLPIIDDRIKEIIREVQEKARAVCRGTQETPLEELGLATARYAHELPTQDPLALTMAFGSMASIAIGWCEYLPTDKKADACEQLKNLADMEILEQGTTLARVFEYVQEYIHIPKIQTVHISETEEEIVRIAVAQISFDLTESFPFTLKNRDEVRTKIFSALEIAKLDGANIVCLPELCLYEEWIGEIKEKYPDMIVIGGSFYKDNKNICPTIMESGTDTPYQPKITPSPFEHGTMGPRMIPGDRIFRYETRFGKFVILICMDFDDLARFFREADIDMIFCPSFNSANERFHNEAHSHVERTPSYILIANTGLHGGTSIFGQLNNNYFGGLVDGGCKECGDSTYKLCEVKKGQEEVIIADFNLDHKGAQVPAPSNPNKVIKSVDNIKKIPIQPDRSRI